MAHSKDRPWRYAIVQHPMWLIIREDTVCAERTPPWGCETIEKYAERLSLGLDALDRFSDLHLNLDFSAVELEDLAEYFPELFQRMRKLMTKDRISFVNGTYSQPHLQILSVESAVQQFEYGLRYLKKLCDYRVTCYAAQEPGLIPQLPQILRAMRFETAATPQFSYGVRLYGGQIQYQFINWDWVAGDDFVQWRALDGTAIPTWLSSYGFPDQKALDADVANGNLRRSRLRAEIPDMVEITPEWVGHRKNISEFVQIDRTLAEMVRSDPPEAVAQIEGNWAYLEGVSCEELSRANTRAESTLLTLEAIESFFSNSTTSKSGFDFHSAWRTLLKAQHHDAYWTGAPELRAKAIAWLGSVTAKAEQRISHVVNSFAQQLLPAQNDAQPVLVVHPYPRRRRVPVELSVNREDLAVVDEKGRDVRHQIVAHPDGTKRLSFVATGRGLGYETYYLRSTESKNTVQDKILEHPFRFANDFYSTVVRPDGVISSLALAKQRDLLNTSKRENANCWLYTEASGDVVPCAKPGEVRLAQGEVLDTVASRVQLGSVDALMRVLLYHELPWFLVETHLDFGNATEIGNYFDDRTKLHFAWFLGKEARVQHALAGSPAQARPRRPFLVNPWIDITLQYGSVALCMFNATKCWIDEEGWLRCVVAWGQHTDRFTPRTGLEGNKWHKPMDLRLKGRVVVRYAVWPHTHKQGVSDVADWAASLLMPPVVQAVEPGNGQMPLAHTFLEVSTPGLVPLSVRPSERDNAVVRLMDVSGKSHSLRTKLDEAWRVQKTCLLNGQSINKIAPHQIVEVHLQRKNKQLYEGTPPLCPLPVNGEGEA